MLTGDRRDAGAYATPATPAKPGERTEGKGSIGTATYEHFDLGSAMRGGMAAMLALLLGSAAALPASALQDVLAGWSGTWKGTYSDDGGSAASLEMQFAVDSAGAPAGKVSFESESGPTTAALEDLHLTRDSLRASLRFQGMIARLRGSRDESGRASGVYTLLSTDGGSRVGSGTWQVTREAAGDR